MDEEVASEFISSVSKNLQILCKNNLNFNENIEVIGHLYVNVDNCTKLNYIVNEKVCKSQPNTDVSKSFHAEVGLKTKEVQSPKDLSTKNFDSFSNHSDDIEINIQKRRRESQVCASGSKLPRLSHHFDKKEPSSEDRPLQNAPQVEGLDLSKVKKEYTEVENYEPNEHGRDNNESTSNQSCRSAVSCMGYPPVVYPVTIHKNQNIQSTDISDPMIAMKTQQLHNPWIAITSLNPAYPVPTRNPFAFQPSRGNVVMSRLQINQAHLDNQPLMEQTKNHEKSSTSRIINETVTNSPVSTVGCSSVPTTSNRFKRTLALTEEQLEENEKLQQSESTQKNTKWAVKMIQDWHQEKYGYEIDFQTVEETHLADVLKTFYCEARPKSKEVEKRSKNIPEEFADTYKRNTYLNIRAGINRHIQQLRMDIDIVNDKTFKSCNRILDGMLKEHIRLGVSPIQHKAVIEMEDLIKINKYFEKFVESSPIVLRQYVWYLICIHYLSHGLKLQPHLRKDSFEFLFDKEGREYVHLKVETLENYVHTPSTRDGVVDKRIYGTGKRNCPVSLLKFFIQKTQQDSRMLFNRCIRDAMQYPKGNDVWYQSPPLKKLSFRNFMPDISTAAKTSITYTAFSLRVTAIQYLNDVFCENRDILFIPGKCN